MREQVGERKATPSHKLQHNEKSEKTVESEEICLRVCDASPVLVLQDILSQI